MKTWQFYTVITLLYLIIAKQQTNHLLGIGFLVLTAFFAGVAFFEERKNP